MTTYYIDFEYGHKENDGLSPATAKNNYTDLDVQSGDRILFKRGSFVRGRLHAKPWIFYGAYGEGAAPTFCGSRDVSAEDDWLPTPTPNVWKCAKRMDGDVGNLIFNETSCTAALHWELATLGAQGDFCSQAVEPLPDWNGNNHPTELYLYSLGNPATVYSHIEAAAYGVRQLVNLDDGMTFEDLRFINSGVHGLAGHGDHITVRRCIFENIGGCPWSHELKIRFGNGFEIWHHGNDILIEDCSFQNIYDSCITHQGPGEDTEPTHRFVCRRCRFDTYGMAAFEYRDKLPVDSVFEQNTCQNAGCGFAMRGETLPRSSEIWPQPMGHHIFLWRIPKATDGGSLHIRDNDFGAAPVGAAIYSIISAEAEAQITLDRNRYTPNETLLHHFGGTSYTDLATYISATGQDQNSVYVNGTGD
ncbi:MAG: hypothetical protein IKV45_00010 [Firmicutes bacterium]|nr:hypothetical protein [Bacillota bacterium]